VSNYTGSISAALSKSIEKSEIAFHTPFAKLARASPFIPAEVSGLEKMRFLLPKLFNRQERKFAK
jgi:hypothetical protein